jgi:hypothetical protein
MTVVARTALVCAAFALLLAATPVAAAAQTFAAGPPAIEAVAAISTSSANPDDPSIVLDLATTVPLATGLDVIVRPYARRLVGGDWDALLYQAQIRYQPVNGLRLDAGIITSPLGLGALELRPDLNPLVGYPFYYFGRLPVFDSYTNRLQVLSGGYPLGAVLSASGARWDGRVGVTDGTPARYRKIFAGDAVHSMPQLVAGGGLTLRPGFRLGAAIASGRYRTADDDSYYGQPIYAGSTTDAGALVMNVEGELAFGYTRLTGEFVRDRFDSDAGPAITRAFYVQGVQTLTPRTFVAGRFTRASSPSMVGGARTRSQRTAAETTAGYRVSPEITLRVGYEASQPFGAGGWRHAAVGSVVWSKRWF